MQSQWLRISQKEKGRGTPKEFARFLAVAMGSLTELDTHFVIAKEIGYITEQNLTEVVESIEEVGRIVTGLRKSLSL